jgi:hypothetical protein
MLSIVRCESLVERALLEYADFSLPQSLMRSMRTVLEKKVKEDEGTHGSEIKQEVTGNGKGGAGTREHGVRSSALSDIMDLLNLILVLMLYYARVMFVKILCSNIINYQGYWKNRPSQQHFKVIRCV